MFEGWASRDKNHFNNLSALYANPCPPWEADPNVFKWHKALCNAQARNIRSYSPDMNQALYALNLLIVECRDIDHPMAKWLCRARDAIPDANMGEQALLEQGRGGELLVRRIGFLRRLVHEDFGPCGIGAYLLGLLGYVEPRIEDGTSAAIHNVYPYDVLARALGYTDGYYGYDVTSPERGVLYEQYHTQCSEIEQRTWLSSPQYVLATADHIRMWACEILEQEDDSVFLSADSHILRRDVIREKLSKTLSATSKHVLHMLSVMYDYAFRVDPRNACRVELFFRKPGALPVRTARLAYVQGVIVALHYMEKVVCSASVFRDSIYTVNAECAYRMGLGISDGIGYGMDKSRHPSAVLDCSELFVSVYRYYEASSNATKDAIVAFQLCARATNSPHKDTVKIICSYMWTLRFDWFDEWTPNVFSPAETAKNEGRAERRSKKLKA